MGTHNSHEWQRRITHAAEPQRPRPNDVALCGPQPIRLRMRLMSRRFVSEKPVNRSAMCAVACSVVAVASILTQPLLAAPPAAPIRSRKMCGRQARLSPEQELKSFHLPPGFTIQLVASEPEIHKPINIELDAKGRLWVTSTVEYPLPVRNPKVTPRRNQGAGDRSGDGSREQGHQLRGQPAEHPRGRLSV